jgi:GAF domain-containing protein
LCAAFKLKLPHRRLNRIKRMNQHLQSTNAVVASVRERLAAIARSEPPQLLEAVVEALTDAQRYSSVEIYLALEGMGVCRSRSHAAGGSTMADVNAEIAVPIMLGTKTLGLLVAETGKRSAPRQERALLQQVAKLIVDYVAANRLTVNRGKQAPRKTSDKLQAGPMPTAKPKGPQSARAAVRKAAAAAGVYFPR